ncbi:DUF4226 domain-containing protein [Candidatus Mycobacterium wuenschmannii]|uniref:DUF4226 domain-containing protein n=1 Tax=Candidatus Mycobacterium wuenschmannii TaxID=3027808 RepID=A0ABY8VSL7_9MYCO|nr:DUF4226 domain-containing protein [Candidatus Mycobacterium wuenschmannii]WIM86628.1 DUF4226 domain-containing protein [Candidatus Mycobacterium wuenschmannii]
MPDDASSADHQEGAAAEAIRSAEIALAHQNSSTAQVDLQVVTAVLNAHQKAAASREALDALQRDIEGAVAARSDLDTPAGARDFQRYLIGKLRDIQAVVAGASLDDVSNSALMAAWTSLYNSSQPDAEPAAKSSSTESHTAPPNFAPDSLTDEFPDDDYGMPPEEAPGAPASAPVPAGMPSMPSFGGGGVPSGGGFGLPGGLPLPSALPEEPATLDDAAFDAEEPDNQLVSDDEGHESKPDEPASGPTTVTLPNGETLTAASPQLAAVIEAAAAGTPIADAFRHEGITIPAPGTPVGEPLDPARLVPGDVGIFTDRHALALGESRALVNGQIQHTSTVSGPTFLGWEHPPVPVNASAPAATDPPAPTRPATVDRPETA